MKINSGKCMLLCLSVFLFVFPSVRSETPPATGTAAECGGDFQKVMICLDFARGKAPSPSKECCDSVEGIKNSEPKCLCYIMQQAHSGGGGETLKSLGVQEAKLLQLPSACNLKNASVANCPKLLGLSPTSPDAAIFTGNATSATPMAPGTTSPSTSSEQQKGASTANAKNGNLLFGLAAFVAIYIILASD